MKFTKTLVTVAAVFIGSYHLVAGQFLDIGNGVISDGRTNLMWQQGEQGKFRWREAKEFCENLELAGHTDWRMPTKQELMSLVEKSMFNPSIDRRFFPDAKPEDYWTTSQGTSGVGSAAWLVNFGYGDTHFFNKTNEYKVRCVR